MSFISKYVNSYVASLASSYVGKYLQGIDPDAIGIAWQGGEVNLKNVSIRPEVFDSLDYPIKLVHGWVGNVKLSLPLSNLFSSSRNQHFLVELENVYLMIGAKHESEWVEEAFINSFKSRRHRLLDMCDMKLMGEQSRDGEEQSSKGWFNRMTGHVVQDVRIKIRHMHIRYEDEGENSTSIGIVLKQLMIYSPEKILIRKVLDLQNLSVYWNTNDSVKLIGKSLSETTNQLDQYFLNHSNDFLLLNPFSFRVELNLEKCAEPPNNIEASFNLANLDVQVPPFILRDFAAINDRFHEYENAIKSIEDRFESYYPYSPDLPYHGNARIWWQYAIGCVARRINKNLMLPNWGTKLKTARISEWCKEFEILLWDHLSSDCMSMIPSDSKLWVLAERLPAVDVVRLYTTTKRRYLQQGNKAIFFDIDDNEHYEDVVESDDDKILLLPSFFNYKVAFRLDAASLSLDLDQRINTCGRVESIDFRLKALNGNTKLELTINDIQIHMLPLNLIESFSVPILTKTVHSSGTKLLTLHFNSFSSSDLSISSDPILKLNLSELNFRAVPTFVEIISRFIKENKRTIPWDQHKRLLAVENSSDYKRFKLDICLATPNIQLPINQHSLYLDNEESIILHFGVLRILSRSESNSRIDNIVASWIGGLKSSCYELTLEDLYVAHKELEKHVSIVDPIQLKINLLMTNESSSVSEPMVVVRASLPSIAVLITPTIIVASKGAISTILSSQSSHQKPTPECLERMHIYPESLRRISRSELPRLVTSSDSLEEIEVEAKVFPYSLNAFLGNLTLKLEFDSNLIHFIIERFEYNQRVDGLTNCCTTVDLSLQSACVIRPDLDDTTSNHALYYLVSSLNNLPIYEYLTYQGDLHIVENIIESGNTEFIVGKFVFKDSPLTLVLSFNQYINVNFQPRIISSLILFIRSHLNSNLPAPDPQTTITTTLEDPISLDMNISFVGASCNCITEFNKSIGMFTFRSMSLNLQSRRFGINFESSISNLEIFDYSDDTFRLLFGIKKNNTCTIKVMTFNDHSLVYPGHSLSLVMDLGEVELVCIFANLLRLFNWFIYSFIYTITVSAPVPYYHSRPSTLSNRTVTRKPSSLQGGERMLYDFLENVLHQGAPLHLQDRLFMHERGCKKKDLLDKSERCFKKQQSWPSCTIRKYEISIANPTVILPASLCSKSHYILNLKKLTVENGLVVHPRFSIFDEIRLSLLGTNIYTNLVELTSTGPIKPNILLDDVDIQICYRRSIMNVANPPMWFKLNFSDVPWRLTQGKLKLLLSILNNNLLISTVQSSDSAIPPADVAESTIDHCSPQLSNGVPLCESTEDDGGGDVESDVESEDVPSLDDDGRLFERRIDYTYDDEVINEESPTLLCTIVLPGVYFLLTPAHSNGTIDTSILLTFHLGYLQCDIVKNPNELRTSITARQLQIIRHHEQQCPMCLIVSSDERSMEEVYHTELRELSSVMFSARSCFILEDKPKELQGSSPEYSGFRGINQIQVTHIKTSTEIQTIIKLSDLRVLLNRSFFHDLLTVVGEQEQTSKTPAAPQGTTKAPHNVSYEVMLEDTSIILPESFKKSNPRVAVVRGRVQFNHTSYFGVEKNTTHATLVLHSIHVIVCSYKVFNELQRYQQSVAKSESFTSINRFSTTVAVGSANNPTSFRSIKTMPENRPSNYQIEDILNTSYPSLSSPDLTWGDVMKVVTKQIEGIVDIRRDNCDNNMVSRHLVVSISPVNLTMACSDVLIFRVMFSEILPPPSKYNEPNEITVSNVNIDLRNVELTLLNDLTIETTPVCNLHIHEGLISGISTNKPHCSKWEVSLSFHFLLYNPRSVIFEPVIETMVISIVRNQEVNRISFNVNSSKLLTINVSNVMIERLIKNYCTIVDSLDHFTADSDVLAFKYSPYCIRNMTGVPIRISLTRNKKQQQQQHDTYLSISPCETKRVSLLELSPYEKNPDCRVSIEICQTNTLASFTLENTVVLDKVHLKLIASRNPLIAGLIVCRSVVESNRKFVILESSFLIQNCTNFPFQVAAITMDGQHLLDTLTPGNTAGFPITLTTNCSLTFRPKFSSDDQDTKWSKLVRLPPLFERINIIVEESLKFSSDDHNSNYLINGLPLFLPIELFQSGDFHFAICPTWQTFRVSNIRCNQLKLCIKPPFRIRTTLPTTLKFNLHSGRVKRVDQVAQNLSISLGEELHVHQLPLFEKCKISIENKEYTVFERYNPIRTMTEIGDNEVWKSAWRVEGAVPPSVRNVDSVEIKIDQETTTCEASLVLQSNPEGPVDVIFHSQFWVISDVSAVYDTLSFSHPSGSVRCPYSPLKEFRPYKRRNGFNIHHPFMSKNQEWQLPCGNSVRSLLTTCGTTPGTETTINDSATGYFVMQSLIPLNRNVNSTSVGTACREIELVGRVIDGSKLNLPLPVSIISVSVHYMICNRTSSTLWYKQADTKNMIRIKPECKSALEYSSSITRHLISLKTEDTNWSGLLNPNTIELQDTFPLHLLGSTAEPPEHHTLVIHKHRGDDDISAVQMDPTIYLTVIEEISLMGKQIYFINESNVDFFAGQNRAVKHNSYCIHPGEKVLFGWDTNLVAEEILLRPAIANIKGHLLKINKLSSFCRFAIRFSPHDPTTWYMVTLSESLTERSIYLKPMPPPEESPSREPDTLSLFSIHWSKVSTQEIFEDSHTRGSLEVHIAISGILVSLIADLNNRTISHKNKSTPSIPTELAVATFTGIRGKFLLSSGNKAIAALTIDDAQLDNQTLYTRTPVILQRLEISQSDSLQQYEETKLLEGTELTGIDMTTQPLVDICIKTDDENSDRLMFVKFLRVILMGLVIKADDVFLDNVRTLMDQYSNCFHLLKPTSANVSESNSVTKFNYGIFSRRDEGALIIRNVAGVAPIAPTKIYIRHLLVHPILIRASYYTTATPDSQTKIVYRFVKSLGNFHDMLLYFEAYSLTSSSLSLSHSFKRVENSYLTQLWSLWYTVPGNADIIGNPISSLSHIGVGLTDLVTNPVKSLQEGNGVEGFGKGFASFFDNTIYGTFNALTKVTETAAQGLGVFSMDEAYNRNRQQRMTRMKPSNVGEGLTYGAEELSNAVLHGIKGLIVEPSKGIESNGIEGFVQGVGRGLMGIVVKPVTGMFDMAALTTSGIQQTSAGSILRGKRKVKRPPRIFYTCERIIRNYDLKDALVIHLLSTIPEFNVDELVIEETIHDPSEVSFLFSDSQLYVVRTTNLGGSILFQSDYSAITGVTTTGKTLRLSRRGVLNKFNLNEINNGKIIVELVHLHLTQLI